MSRLEELIAELCPEGVEYKTLGEIATDVFVVLESKEIKLRKLAFLASDMGRFTLHMIFGLIIAYHIRVNRLLRIRNILNMGIFCLRLQARAWRISRNLVPMLVMKNA